MSHTLTITLPEPLRACVAGRVQSGGYGNTSEYVRDRIREHRRKQRIEALRSMVGAGPSGGSATAYTQADRKTLEAIARGVIV